MGGFLILNVQKKKKKDKKKIHFKTPNSSVGVGVNLSLNSLLFCVISRWILSLLYVHVLLFLVSCEAVNFAVIVCG